MSANAAIKLTPEDPSPIVWVRDANIENWLNKTHNVKFIYHPAYPIEKIDRVRSRKNMARLGPAIVEENQLGMLALIEDAGYIELAPLVGMAAKPTPNGEMVLADGNNRDELAVRLGLTTVALYEVIDCGPDTFDWITRTANTQVGSGANEETRLEHAVKFFDRMKGTFTIKDVAHKFRIGESLLGRRFQAYTLAQRFSPDGDMPIPGATKLSTAVLTRLAPLGNKNDTLLRAAAEGLLALPVVPLERHINLIAKYVREAKPREVPVQLAAITKALAEIDQQLKESTSKSKALPRHVRVMLEATRFFNALDREFKVSGIKDVIIDPTRRAEYVEMLRKIKTSISKIEKGV